MSKKVAVIMGSDSDWPVVKAACAQLEEFGIQIGRASCRERVSLAV